MDSSQPRPTERSVSGVADSSAKVTAAPAPQSTLADAHRFELYDAFSLGDDAVVELRRPRPHDKESD